MNAYTLIATITTLAVIIGYLNYRFIKMPPTIAIMVGSLTLSLLLLIIGQFGLTGLEQHVEAIVANLNFHDLLINGMLSFLLFAGALNVKITHLKDRKWEIGILATVSTIVSTLLVGVFSYFLLHLLGVHMAFVYCLLFGALISPTDPIAVLATFKKLNAPKKLDVMVAGESLFNDGVGIVIFLTIYQLVTSNTEITTSSVTLLFLRQAIGGIGYGIILGYAAYWLIKPLQDHKITILITLAIVTGGYTLAQAIDISGPLAMVVAGIIVGNSTNKFAMSKHGRETLESFWELIDEILNTILFLLIGLELLLIHADIIEISAALLAIPMVLLVRFITVATPMHFFKRRKKYAPFATSILVWGGLRGGLAVALALTLPPGHHRTVILAMTYAVVLFAIIVQGLTVKPLVKLTKL